MVVGTEWTQAALLNLHVTGTGAEHSITVADVERAAEAAQPPAAPTTPAPTVAAKGLDLAGIRRVIAAAMARSKREIPHYYLSTTIDMISLAGNSPSWHQRARVSILSVCGVIGNAGT